MPVTLTTTQSDGTVRISVTLDAASETNVQLAINADMNLVNAAFTGAPRTANGTVETASSFDDGVLTLGTSTDLPGPLAAGTELYAYEFDTSGPGSIQITDFLVLKTDGPGTFSETADLITVTFEGGTAQTPTDGPDRLAGTPQAETLTGLGGNDTLEGSPGVDTLNGGDGIDIAAMTGPRDDYQLVISTTGTTLIDRRPGGDETDTLIDIETLTFEGEAAADPLDLTKFGGAASLTAEEFNTIIELYIAYYNRAPDALGLNFWSTAFADGLSLDAIAALFAGQPETLAAYPEGTSSTVFATTVYTNVLGRDPDADGLNFWVGQLESGGVTRDAFILEVLKGAKAAPADGASQEFIDQQLADQSYLDSKTDVGAFYSVHLGMSNVENARSVMQAYGSSATKDEIGARNVAEDLYDLADDPTTGEFLMPIVGVLVDDFSGLI